MQKSEQDCRAIIDAADLESSSNKSAISVLHVDDDPCVLEISKQILMDMGNFEIEFAFCVDEAFKKLSTEHYDIVVSDFEMPQKDGLDFLKELREQNNQIPFILFTGKGREDVAIKALNLGADRYIDKQGNPKTVYGELSDALIKTVEHQQSKKMLVESESKYRKLVENSLQGIAIIQGPPPKFVFANAAMKELFGYTPKEMIALSPEQIIRNVHPEDRKAFFDRFKKRIEGRETESNYVFRGFRKDGSLRWVEVCANLIEFNGKPAVQGVFLDITESKKAEESLRESEQRYRELANCLPDIVFETDLNGRLEFANERAAQISGYCLKEIEKGLNILQFIVPEDRQRAERKIQKLLSGSSYTPAEYNFLRKDGTTFPALVTATPRIRKNTITGLRGIALDISERKKIERSLLESEKMFRTLAEESPNMIFINVKGRVVYANKKCEEITGYSREEFYSPNFNFFSLNPPEYIETVKSTYFKHMRNEAVPPYEYVLITKDGKRLNAIINTTIIEYNGDKAILGIITDITERKKAEDAVERSAICFRSLYENSFDAILLTKPDGSILSANPAACRLFCMSEKEIKVAGQAELVVKNERLTLAIEERERTGKAKAEITFRRKDGSTFEGESTSSIFVDADGIAKTSMIIRDITEKKRLESELKQKYDVIERVGESIGAGLAIIGKDYSIFWANKLLRDVMVETNKKCYQTFNKLGTICPDCGVKKVFEQNISLDVHEFRTVDSKGETAWIELRVTPLRDNEGKVTAALELAVPITERKAAEEKLCESQHLTQKILDCSPNLIYIYDLFENCNVYANREVFAFLGYTPLEIKIMGSELFAKILHPDDAEVVAKHHARFANAPDNATYDVEYRMKNASGEWRWLRSRDTLFARTQEGLGNQILGICEDITERKAAEDALKESEKRSRAIVANSPIGIATSSANKRFLSANEAFCKIPRVYRK